MSKYSHIEDGKVLDWKFKKTANDPVIYSFYVGDLFIGQIFKDRKQGWHVVHWANPIPMPVGPFCTRMSAATFMLDWRRVQLRTAQSS